MTTCVYWSCAPPVHRMNESVRSGLGKHADCGRLPVGGVAPRGQWRTARRGLFTDRILCAVEHRCRLRVSAVRTHRGLAPGTAVPGRAGSACVSSRRCVRSWGLGRPGACWWPAVTPPGPGQLSRPGRVCARRVRRPGDRVVRSRFCTAALAVPVRRGSWARLLFVAAAGIGIPQSAPRTWSGTCPAATGCPAPGSVAGPGTAAVTAPCHSPPGAHPEGSRAHRRRSVAALFCARPARQLELKLISESFNLN